MFVAVLASILSLKVTLEEVSEIFFTNNAKVLFLSLGVVTGFFLLLGSVTFKYSVQSILLVLVRESATLSLFSAICAMLTLFCNGTAFISVTVKDLRVSIFCGAFFGFILKLFMRILAFLISVAFISLLLKLYCACKYIFPSATSTFNIFFTYFHSV